MGPWILAAILFLISLFFAWGAFTNWNKAAVVYQNGMAYRDRQKIHTWRWTDFQSMTSAVTKHYTNGIYTGTTHIYTLFNKDGEKILLKDTISNVEELATRISKKIFPLLYEEYAQIYNLGQDCDFGPVKLNKANGIQIGKKQYTWGEIEQVAIQKGVLSIKKKGGGWFTGASASASNIPNLEVMLSIIDQVVGLQTS